MHDPILESSKSSFQRFDFIINSFLVHVDDVRNDSELLLNCLLTINPLSQELVTKIKVQITLLMTFALYRDEFTSVKCCSAQTKLRLFKKFTFLKNGTIDHQDISFKKVFRLKKDIIYDAKVKRTTYQKGFGIFLVEKLNLNT